MDKQRLARLDDNLLKIVSHPDMLHRRYGDYLSTLVKEIMNNLEVERVSIWRFDAEAEALHIEYEFHVRTLPLEKVRTITASQAPVYFRALQDNRTIVAENVETDPDLAEVKNLYYERLGIKSVLQIPLWIHGRLEGVLKCETLFAQRLWTMEDVLFLSQVSALVVQNLIGLRNAHMENGYNLQRSILENICQEKYTERAILHDLVVHLARLVSAQQGMIYIMEPGLECLRAAVSYNMPATCMENLLMKGEGVAGQVMETGTSVRIHDVQKSELEAEVDPHAHAAMAVPICSGKELIGVLLVQRTISAAGFSQQDLQSLRSAAHLAAMILKRWQERKVKEREQNLLRILEQVMAPVVQIEEPEWLIRDSLLALCKELEVDAACFQLDDEFFEEGQESLVLSTVSDFFSKAVVGTQTTLTFSTELSSLEYAQNDLIQLQEMGIRSAILIPVGKAEQGQGYLVLVSAQPRVFSKQEVEQIETVAKALARMFVSVRLRQESSLLRSYTAGLKICTGMISGSFSFKEAVNAVGEGGLWLSRADHAAVYVPADGSRIECAWHHNLSREHIFYITSPRAERFAARIFSFRAPLIIKDSRQIELEPMIRNVLATIGSGSMALWPIRSGSKVLAVLACYYNSPRDFVDIEVASMHTFTNQAAVALHNARLFDLLERRYMDMAIQLVRAITARETGAASDDTTLEDMALSVARRLRLAGDELTEVRWAARLHDIGKSILPDDVLQKPGPLSESEWEQIQQVPVEGERFIKPLPRFRMVGTIIRNFREHYNGKGYPDGLSGEQIPVGARILAVVDAYQSMINKRAYKDSLTPELAMAELVRCSNQQFDPRVVDAFALTLEDQK